MNRRRFRVRLCLACSVAALMAPPAAAADEQTSASAAPKLNVETVLDKLDHPCGLAPIPGTPAILLSESGAGRVVRFHPDKPGETSAVITGFPSSQSNGRVLDQSGPLGLVFLNQNTAAVGTNCAQNGQELLRTFAISKDKSIDYQSPKQKIGPIAAGKESESGESNFAALAVTPEALYVVSGGDPLQGWVLRAGLKSGTLAKLEPFIATVKKTGVENPRGLAVNPRGMLVVGQTGRPTATRDSQLTFYSAAGDLLWSVPAECYDLVALAYSPKSGRLYALDFAAAAPDEAGLYRLDASTVNGRPGVMPVKLASIDRPTSLTFTPDNILYVAAFGPDPHSDNADLENPAANGMLLRITGDL